jgi:hypothetical protein
MFDETELKETSSEDENKDEAAQVEAAWCHDIQNLDIQSMTFRVWHSE